MFLTFIFYCSLAHLKRVILLAVVICALQTVLMLLCLKVVRVLLISKKTHLVVIVIFDAIRLSAVTGERMVG